MPNQIYRVSQGAQLSGVCAGLEAAGKGSVLMWRVAFFIGGWFYAIGVIVYIYFACTWPKAKTSQDARELAGLEDREPEGVTATSQLEMKLERLAAMKEKGLINQDEFEKMRIKALGLE